MAKIILQDVRCSYVFVESPRKATTNDDGTVTPGKYGVQILIDKNDKQVAKINKAIKLVAKEKFGEKVKLTMLKTPLRDGDTERDTDECKGMYFMNVNATRKPGIVNRHNEPADADDLEELCFSGAYFHVSIALYAFSRDGNKGVAAGLNNLMLRKVGERLDGNTTASKDFEEYSDDDLDGDLDDDDLDDDLD